MNNGVANTIAQVDVTGNTFGVSVVLLVVGSA